MRERLLKSVAASVEWRIFAFLITEVFFFFTTGELWHATVLAASLQILLFVGHLAWYYVRETGANTPRRA